MHYVVDASVAAKWLLPEEHSGIALRLLEGRDVLIAPDFLAIEIANVLWKRAGAGAMSREYAQAQLRALNAARILLFPAADVVHAALEIATAFKRSVYDCLYLALAEERDCSLITADRRFFNAMRATPLARRVVWVEEIASV